MKIALLTSVPSFIENKRIEKEVCALGHEFQMLNMSDFSFAITGKNTVVNRLQDLNADIVFVRGILKSIKPVSAAISDLRKRGIKIFDNNFLNHRYSIDKVTDILKLALADIPVPDTYYSRDFSKFPAVAEKIGYPVVMKSTRMGKGASVFKAESEKELQKLIQAAESKGHQAKSYLLQQMIPYAYDLRVLIIGDHVYAMRRIPAEGEFRANFSLGGAVELFDLDDQGKQLAKRALESIDMSVGGVDILITEDNRRYILEVNHTAGFAGMEEATGQNIGKQWVEHAISKAE